MDKAQQIYKKYTGTVVTIRLSAVFLYLLLAAIMNFIGLFPIAIPLAVVLAVIARKLTLFKFRRHITSIIIDDLDAQLYREVITSSGIGATNILFLMESEFFVGNISGAIAIAEAAYENSSVPKKTRISSLAFLALYYYVLGDDEGLASVCRRFRESELPRRGKYFKNTEKVISKYEYYLAGDYDSFVKPITPNQRGTLYPLVTSFNEARVALKNGDEGTARAIFSALSVSAENTVYGMISKRAVNAIENGGEYKDAALIESEPTDADGMIKNHVEAVKRMKKTNRIWLVIWAVILLIFLPNSIRSWLGDVEERITLDLLEDHYDSVEIVDMLRFKVDGKQTEFTFIADVESGLIIGARYRNSDGEWEVETYGYCPYSELESEGTFGYAFNTHDNSALLYFKISDYYEVHSEDDHLHCQVYHVNGHLITVVIDDEALK